MFDIFFGWRKASKCKRLIKRVQCKLKLLKNKRHSILRQLREDVAQLIKIGYEDIAFNRAEQLFKDENIMALYELLDNFCEFILINLSYIRKNKDCPNDINEAVSTLIFASARCGDLPELRVIRKLFRERYGQRFEMTALELLPGNLVNLEVKKRLSIQSISDDVKQRLVDEIARDCCLRPEILALEYTSELQQQTQEKEHCKVLKIPDTDVDDYVSKIELPQMEALDVNCMEGKEIYIASASTCLSSTVPSHSQQDYDVISTSVSPSIAQQSSPDIQESLLQDKAEIIENVVASDSPHTLEPVGVGTKESHNNGSACMICAESNEQQKMMASSSESLPRLPDEVIVYLDDIEEIQSFITKSGSCQDQSIFKFKSSVQPKSEKVEEKYDMKYMDHNESWSEMSIQSSSRKKVKATRKRSRRRSVSLENSTTDIDCLIYYEKPCKKYPPLKHKSHLHSMHHSKDLIQKCELLCLAETRQKQPHSSQCFQLEEQDCCLNHPCYFCTSTATDYQKFPPRKQKGGIRAIPSHQKQIAKNFNYFHCSERKESDTEVEWYTFSQRPRRKFYDFDHIARDLPAKKICNNGKQSKIMNPKLKEFKYQGRHWRSNESCPEVSSPSTRNGTKPPYLRAMTMPQERCKDSHNENVLRSRSFPIESPSHVHPNLPDYDDIASKFMALKKEHLKNKFY